MPGSDEKPGVDAILQKLLDAAPFQLVGDGGVEAARKRLRDVRVPEEMLPDLRTEDRTVDIGGERTIALRCYWPPGEVDGPIPVVVFFHGGGFALGDLETHDALSRAHAVGAGAVVVSVDYRLAPEHPYPAAVEDAWAATRWVAAHAAELGADPARLAVAGDSAGGNLAAVVSQLARDAGGPPIAFQLLWYPATSWDFSLPSLVENAHAPILDRPAVEACSRWYAGHVDPNNLPPTLAPARAESLAGLPPAYIAVAGHDPLRDDGARYAELLGAAGVPVQLHNAETLVHGYAGFAVVVPAAAEAVEAGLRALRVALRGKL
ncbi:MAG: alpha/beta hydrolase [Mycobacteriaceae bacterium]|nr:alpha/beta hydrolase [Mycobacteriaceae bacterium]MBV9638177.1 alpha/beta hydrolase [Mycobacteriaceae bacterium]